MSSSAKKTKPKRAKSTVKKRALAPSFRRKRIRKPRKRIPLNPDLSNYYKSGIAAAIIGVGIFCYQGFKSGWKFDVPPTSLMNAERQNLHRAQLTSPDHPSLSVQEMMKAETRPQKTEAGESRAVIENQKQTLSALEKSWSEAATLSVPERVSYWSLQLEQNTKARGDLPKLNSIFSVNDIAPLIPVKFNCTTFVETVMALSMSHDLKSFYKALVSIRYKGGEPSFTNRNHFPELDWIPNITQGGIATDITATLSGNAGLASNVEIKRIDRGQWLAKQIQSLGGARGLASENAVVEGKAPAQAAVAYVSLADLPKIASRIPSGTIVNLVHKNDDRHPVLITHQGFIIQDQGKTYLRHASSKGWIRTNELLSYLNRLVLHEDRSWPLLGVNLNQLNLEKSQSH